METTINFKQYKAARGSHLTDEQAEVYGKRIDELLEENNGEVTPDIVLNDAKHESSPLHSYFEWDNNEAAEKYRKMQAGHLIRYVCVVIQQDEEKEQEIRAFPFVTINNEDKYTSLFRVLSDDDLHKQMVQKALRELDLWRKKYRLYDELKDIFDAMDKIPRNGAAG